MVRGAEEASAEIINRCVLVVLFFLGLDPSASWGVLRVEEIAKKKNVTMAQISLLQQDPIAAPIVGTTSLYDIIG